MYAEDVDRIFQGLDDALHDIETVREDAELYAERADHLVKHMRVICDQIDITDPRLMTFGDRLSREFVFAVKSAELRSPVAAFSNVRAAGLKY